MEQAGIAAIGAIAKRKVAFLKKSPLRYSVYAAMAGVFCGLGMILAYSAGGALNASVYTQGFAKIVFGISFSLSFTLIIYAGSELFTGNVLVASAGALEGHIPLGDGAKLLAVGYIADLLGATAIGLTIGASGLVGGQVTGGYILENSLSKMALPFGQAFVRGILCNMLVCLATWAVAKLTSDPAKLLIVFLCVYGFCTSGFEHSIANMALFIMALFTPGAQITAGMVLRNMLPVTLGNLVGGFLIALIYWFISSEKKKG